MEALSLTPTLSRWERENVQDGFVNFANVHDSPSFELASMRNPRRKLYSNQIAI